MKNMTKPIISKPTPPVYIRLNSILYAYGKVKKMLDKIQTSIFKKKQKSFNVCFRKFTSFFFLPYRKLGKHSHRVQRLLFIFSPWVVFFRVRKIESTVSPCLSVRPSTYLSVCPPSVWIFVRQSPKLPD